MSIVGIPFYPRRLMVVRIGIRKALKCVRCCGGIGDGWKAGVGNDAAHSVAVEDLCGHETTADDGLEPSENTAEESVRQGNPLLKEEVRQRILDHTGEVIGGGVEIIGVTDTARAQGIKTRHRPVRG